MKRCDESRQLEFFVTVWLAVITIMAISYAIETTGRVRVLEAVHATESTP